MESRPGFWATVSAVFSAFAGIRRKSAYQRDAAQFRPLHLIIAGLIGGLVFVIAIVLVVRLVISQAAA